MVNDGFKQEEDVGACGGLGWLGSLDFKEFNGSYYSDGINSFSYTYLITLNVNLWNFLHRLMFY